MEKSSLVRVDFPLLCLSSILRLALCFWGLLHSLEYIFDLTKAERVGDMERGKGGLVIAFLEDPDGHICLFKKIHIWTIESSNVLS